MEDEIKALNYFLSKSIRDLEKMGDSLAIMQADIDSQILILKAEQNKIESVLNGGD